MIFSTMLPVFVVMGSLTLKSIGKKSWMPRFVPISNM